MSEQHDPEFEDRLRTLLARTAEAIPADTDLSARVRQVNARDTRRAGGAGPRHVLATVAAVLVVALLASVLAFVRLGAPALPGGGTARPTAAPFPVVVPPTCGPFGPDNPPPPPGPLVDHSVAVGRSASLHGITITIDRAYADATQTVITYHMQTSLNPPLPSTSVLMDAQGRRYPMILGNWDIQRAGNVVFAALPPEELSTPQTLTFFTQQMLLDDPTGPGAMVDGPWQISFSLTPVAGASVPLSTTPVTHNGLTIQPVRLDLAAAGGGLDGATGGARVVVRLSGLAPSMRLFALPAFNTVFALGGGGSIGCGGGALLLVLPSGRQMAPGFVHPLGQTVPLTPAEQQAVQAQTVGPSGTADLEALFYMPIPAGTSVTLYVDHVAAQVAGAAEPEQIRGPWEFRLLPSA